MASSPRNDGKVEEPDAGESSMSLTVWKIMDDPSSGTIAKYWSVFMMFVILFSIFNFTIASIPQNLILIDVWTNISTGDVIPFSTLDDFTYNDGVMTRTGGAVQTADKLDDYLAPWREFEVFCISVFTFDFVVRLLTCPAGPGLCKFLAGPSNIIDLVSIVPFYLELVMVAVGDGGSSLGFLQVLRLIRLTRITRIFKMSKSFEGIMVLFLTIARSLSALLMLFFFMAVFSVLFATLIYTCEKGTFDANREQFVREDGSESPFESIPASTWWTIITMTTVGYGDHYPVSGWGRVIAVITMIVALLVLSLPITIIGSNFDEEYSEMRKRKVERDKAMVEQKAKERAARAVAALQNKGEKPSPGILNLPDVSKMQTCVTKLAATGTLSPGGDGDQRGVADKQRWSNPLTAVERLIAVAHADILREVEDLMAQQENELRATIESVLSKCPQEVAAQVHGTSEVAAKVQATSSEG